MFEGRHIPRNFAQEGFDKLLVFRTISIALGSFGPIDVCTRLGSILHFFRSVVTSRVRMVNYIYEKLIQSSTDSISPLSECLRSSGQKRHWWAAVVCHIRENECKFGSLSHISKDFSPWPGTLHVPKLGPSCLEFRVAPRLFGGKLQVRLVLLLGPSLRFGWHPRSVFVTIKGKLPSFSNIRLGFVQNEVCRSAFRVTDD